jgi:ankyrin repeat protein
MACVNGHVGMARLLLERKASVDQTDKEGNTILGLACQNSQVSYSLAVKKNS